MVYDKGSSSPPSGRGQDTTTDSEEANPDVIPVNDGKRCGFAYQFASVCVCGCALGVCIYVMCVCECYEASINVCLRDISNYIMVIFCFPR